MGEGEVVMETRGEPCRILAVRAILWDSDQGDYLVEARDPVSGLYQGPHVVRVDSPDELAKVLGDTDTGSLGAVSLCRGKVGDWSCPEDTWAALLQQHIIDDGARGLSPSLFLERGDLEWASRPGPVAHPVAGTSLRTEMDSPRGSSILDLQGDRAPVFVNRIDVTYCNDEPATVTFWVQGHRGLCLTLEASLLLQRDDDEWEPGATVALYDVAPFGRVGLYPLRENVYEWWDKEVFAHIDPETQRVLTLVIWELNGNTVERWHHKWIPLEPEGFDALNGTRVVRVHPDFVALFDIEEYRRGYPSDRSLGLSLETVDAYAVTWN
jgi:hypothetical protein